MTLRDIRFFVMGMIVWSAIAACLTIANAYSQGNSYPDTLDRPMTPVGSQYQARPEAQVVIERYTPIDWKNDPTVLYAGPKDNGGEVKVTATWSQE